MIRRRTAGAVLPKKDGKILIKRKSDNSGEDGDIVLHGLVVVWLVIWTPSEISSALITNN